MLNPLTTAFLSNSLSTPPDKSVCRLTYRAAVPCGFLGVDICTYHAAPVPLERVIYSPCKANIANFTYPSPSLTLSFFSISLSIASSAFFLVNKRFFRIWIMKPKIKLLFFLFHNFQISTCHSSSANSSSIILCTFIQSPPASPHPIWSGNPILNPLPPNLPCAEL